MAQKIEIPVSLNAQIDNLKQVRTTLVNSLNAAGKESTLAKTLTKDLGKVNEWIRELEDFSLQPTVNESEFRHIQTIFDRLVKQFQSSFTQIDFSGFEQIASEADIGRLKTLTQEASKYRKELEAIQKYGSVEKTETYLTRTNNQQLLDQGRTLKGFDSTATLNKNAVAMEKAAESYRRSAVELQETLDTLDQEAAAAENRAKGVKDRVDDLTTQYQTLRTDSRIADFHYRAASFETGFSANSQMRNPVVGSIRSGLQRTLETVYADGKIATDAREAVSNWIRQLAPNISTAEAARMVQQDLTTLLEDLMEEIFGAGYRGNNDLLYGPNHSAILSRVQGYSRAEINRLNRKHSTTTVADIGTRTKEVYQQLKREQAEYQRLDNEINKKQAKWDELDEQQSDYLNAANEASKLSQELYVLADAAKAAAEASKQAQIAQNEAEQEDLKNRTTGGVKKNAAPGAGQILGLRENLKEFGIDTGDRFSGGKSAEDFKHNLQMSIRQWMSAQQIVNIIKDGLRQAIQDIQGLDKAMTNIAVVTDMSVGDLWGKINDYMSIAQQYGVTTQGVYEVSQLYYQQGLSTSEVMAATTETLKMARIAGMDYAEAADAMTVAIRAFKMEMSDAQTVTDVYSKVAAVTASDSEELAIAMSKTASSAESVGSSFENTTAMLAVMIETTRESAQNLGSALKSIISRYGEMKTGLTVDSEGEAIDYNKVDTALKSVGISIKDAQGQFREFDDVIFELSEKWDSLDKNTQRYIATIMAGNRQQSRFIALVDNWERLDEVATAAQDSEDAGLLQYAKTLDSLETKINNIKTSFQEFYMSILNGPVIGAALEFINDLIKGLNKLSKFTTILNITSIISGFKVLGSILVNTFSTAFSQVSGGWKSMLENMTLSARTAGAKAGKQYQMGWSTGQSGTGKTLSSKATLGISALSLVGTGLTMAGTAVANKNQEAGTILSSLGTGLQIGTMVGMINPVVGVITGALAAIVSGIASWPSELEKAQQNLDKAKEKAEEANIERAQSKERYTNLRDTLKELERLKEIRFDSDANFDEWIKANEQALESYPELISTFDEANNAIVDLEAAEANLMQARMQAASAAREAADAQIAQALAQRAIEQIEYTNTSEELNELTGTIEYDDKYGAYAQYFTAARIPAETAKELINILHMTGEVPALLDQTIWAQQGRTAYGVLDPTSKDAWSLRTTNKQWAEAAKFLDMDTVAVSQWWALMAQITDGAEFAQMLSKTFSSDYLKEEYSEKDLLALLTNNKYTSARELAAASPEASRKLKQSDLAVDASLRSGINAYLDSYLLGLDSENTFLELGNAKQTMSLALIESFNEDFQIALADDQSLNVEEYWKNWIETNFVTLSTELKATLDELYKNLSIAGDIDEYNDLIKNASSYNKDEYTTALGDLGLEVSTGIGKILVDQFTEKATKASEDFKAALENIDADTDTDLNFEAALTGSGVSIPQAYTDEVTEYARRLQKQVSSGLMGDDDANTYFEEYLRAWKKVLATNDIALRELFAETDFQSLESVATLLTSLSEKGLLGEGDGQVSQQTLESLIPHALINLNTSYSSLISNLAKDIDAKAAQINKAQSGFDTLADTQQFAEDMGLTLDDFTFDNGKWYVQATKESFAKIQNKTGEILEKQRDLVEKSFTKQLNLIEGDNQLKDLTTKEAPEDVDQLLTVLTQDSGETLSEETQAVLKANWSNYIDWIAANNDKVDTTFAQYLKNTYEATLSALDQEQTDYFDWLEKEWTYSESIRNRVSELSGDETAQRKQKAWDTIASKGTEGYSAQDIAEIETALGVQDVGIKQADGTFALDWANEELQALNPAQYVQNAVNASIEQAIKSAEESLQKLGETAATGEKLSATEIISLLGNQFKDISPAAASRIYEAFLAQDQLELEQTIYEALTQIDTEPTVALEQAKQILKEIYPEVSDAFTDSSTKLLELQGKALRGELTAMEAADAVWGSSEIPVKDFKRDSTEAVQAYLTRLLNEASLSFADKVKSIQENVYAKEFETQFGPSELQDFAQTTVTNEFGSQDAASSFLAKLTAITGTEYKISDWFVTQADGTYELIKSIEEVEAEILKTTDENLRKALQKQLDYYEDLQKLQRKESLTSSFSSMAAAEEIKASELIKLYEDQGAQLIPEDALKEAERLNALNPLERFEELTKIFDGFEADLDIETIRKTGNAVKVSFQETANRVKTSAENLGSKIIAGNDELQDYMSVFGEEITDGVANQYNYAIEMIRSGKDRLGANKAALKRAIAKNLQTDINDKAVTEAYDALFDSADDASYELVDTVFNAKIEALESGHLSAASKEILKSDNQGTWIDTFNAIIGGAADERAKLIFEEKAKAYNEYLAAERITEAEHLEGIAQSATDYFASLSDSIDAANQAYYAEAAEAIASGDRAYSRDELGKLYASAWKQGKVTDPDVFAIEYVKSWNEAGEAILDVKKLREANIVTSRQVAEFSENLTNNVFSAAEDVINKMSSGLKVDNHEVQAIFDELGMQLTDADAEAIINGGLNTLLNRLQLELMTAGADSSDIAEKVKELQITIIDMITEALTSGFSALAEGIEGTLSEASYNELQKMYDLSNSSIRTSKGVQLNQADQRALIRGLYSRAAASGKTAGFGEELWKTLSESEDSTIKGYKDIQEEIDTITEKIGENAAATDEYVQALEAAKLAAMDAADAADFAFMEQDGYDGRADIFDKFTENVTKAKEALTTFGKGGKIAHADLTAMFDVIKSSDSGLKAFNNALAGTNLNIDEMLNTALRLNELGEIDIGKVAAEWGIDIETATSAMAEGMSASLKETAKGQIKYLSGLEAMLEAMVALEGIGGIKLDLEFDTGLTDSNGDPIIVKQLSEVYDWWDKLDNDKQKALQYDIDLTLKNASTQKPLQSFMKGFGLGDADFFTTFFGKGVDSDMEVQLADAFGTLFEQLPNLTAGQAQTVAEEMNRVLQGAILTDKEGNFAGWKDNYIDSLLQFFSTFNLSDIPESLSAEISETLAANNNKIIIPVKDGINIAIQSSKDNKGFNVVDAQGNALTGLSDEQISAIKSTLAKDYAMAVEDIRIDADTGLVSFYGEAAKAETEALKTEFTSISEAATGVSDAINKLQTLLSSFQISDSFRDFVGLMTQLITGSTGIAKTVEGAQNAANMEQLNAEVDGENERIITLKINIKEAEKSFAEIETAFNLLVTLLSTPITINVNSIGAISGAAISQTDGNTPPNTNPNGGVSSPLSSHTVQIIWDVQKPDFSQIKEPTIGFDWKQPATAPGPRTLPTINFRWGSAVNDPEYTGSAIKIPIEYVESITEDAEVVAWTGTMNDISGAAFADGSIGRLYSGAQLAGKTLVGELGPELAVYDGQYHLLGQHGAEFVNLPSDAIVFNHRQTEGIARGQFNIRGKAMAEGNITGPAMAGGAAAALEAVRRAKSLWQGLLDSLSAAELTSMGGGGGGGNNLKAIHEDLQEWYNLSRKIANIEQEINNIIAERQNIAAGDGGAYLRSLREEQALLQQQIANQEILQQYQEEQLKRQAEHINNNKIWSQFLQIGPDGLLQYTNGNERFGGKGALEVLAQLNKMSAQEQINFITDLGYSYTDQNGKQLTGSDLVAKFFEELQLQIDQYDALYDAVHESSEALANLQNNINKINEEIRQNKIDLENSIYDVLVEAWEAEIEALEEQKELIEEANEAYIDGLNDALQAERDMYDQQQSVADRESLQRQLALLRRSGGSASEIADLERQLDDMLKQEYFDSQQKTIENIQDANEKQIKQLERQIQLQEEALTYQKENGVLWAKVAEIMDGSPESILAILQGNSSAFFAASTEQQAKMLEEWAMKVGIYTEDRIYQQHASFAKEKIWDSGDVWNEEGMGEFKDYYAGLDEKDRNTIRDVYTHAYANALLKGEKPEDARKAAAKAASDALKKKQEADKDKKNDDTDDTGDTSNPGGSTPTYSKIKIEISCSPPEGGTASASPNPCEPNTTVTVTPKANSGYKFTHITVGGQSKTGLSFTVTGNVNPVKVIAYFEPVDTSTSEEATAAAKTKVKQDPEATYIAKKYSKGGLVDYTGLAMVHGSPSKPEGFLNAEQTEIISQALTTVGDGGALDGIKRTLAALNANVQSIVNHVSNEVSSFTVAPGAVTIQVEELKDSYDIEKLSNDIMNRMVTIASKSTNRGINRR